jgi:ankyrin repeat protein
VSGKTKDTQLGHAVRSVNIPLLEMMIKLGADVNHVNGEEDTPLISAVKNGDGSEIYQKMVQILVDAGARNGKKDANGQRARQIARERGYDEISAIIKEG